MPAPLTYIVTAHSLRLDKYLVQAEICTSRTEALRWIEEGRVLVTDKVVKAASIVRTGMEVTVDKPPLKTSALTAKPVPFGILFEDDEVIVIDKPAGLVVHPGAGNYDESLVHGLLHHCRGKLSGIGGVERPGIVHRLDKGTSGVMIVAKSDRAHQDLSRQFQEHTVEKKYLALVVGEVLKTGQTLIHLMKRAEMNRKKFVVNLKKGKRAVTHVSVIAKNARMSFVSAVIETGRTHQVRVHLSHIGHPIVGDETYGGTKKLHAFDEDEKRFIRNLGRPLLHSSSLAFTHPVSGKRMEFEAPLTRDFTAAVERFLCPVSG